MQRLVNYSAIAGAAMTSLVSSAYAQEGAEIFEDTPVETTTADTTPSSPPATPVIETAPTVSADVWTVPQTTISESAVRGRVSAFGGYDEAFTYGGASFDMIIPSNNDVFDSLAFGIHGLGGFEWFNISEDDKVQTLYRTSNRNPFLEGLFGIGTLFDVNSADGIANESSLELLLGYRYFNLEQQDTDDNLMLNRNDAIIGFALGLSEQLSAVGKYYGLTQQKDYESYSVRLDLSTGDWIADGDFRLMLGVSADRILMRELDQRSLEAYGGVEVTPRDANLLVGGAFRARYADIFDDLGNTRLDRQGRFADDRELWSYGGFGRIGLLLQDNVLVYADIGGDSVDGFTLQGGFQWRFGLGDSYAAPGRTYSPSLIRPPTIVDTEHGGPGVQ